MAEEENVIVVPRGIKPKENKPIAAFRTEQKINLEEFNRIKSQINKTHIKIRVYKLSAYKDITMNMGKDIDSVETDLENEAIKRATKEDIEWKSADGYVCDILGME